MRDEISTGQVPDPRWLPLAAGGGLWLREPESDRTPEPRRKRRDVPMLPAQRIASSASSAT
jgi:hypothetical protein